MTKGDLKAKLLETCRTKLLASISGIEAAMNDAQQQANDYGPPRDRYDAFRSQLLRRRDMLAQQLDKDLNELKTLEKIDPGKRMDKAGFGALILTPEQNYFISIGMGKVLLEDMEVYAISPLVPISQILNGKKEGDSVEFRGKKILISEIY